MRILEFIIVCTLSWLLVTGCSVLKKGPEKSAYPDLILEHQALINQRLIPRPGHLGFLTNQVCKKYVGKTCVERSLMKYDLVDMSVRENLVNGLKFACRMGEKRYRISIPAPAIIRQESGCVKWKKKPISRKKYCAETGVVKSEFIHIADEASYQKLIDGALECRSGF
jgi:hypothetical protein